MLPPKKQSVINLMLPPKKQSAINLKECRPRCVYQIYSEPICIKEQ